MPLTPLPGTGQRPPRRPAVLRLGDPEVGDGREGLERRAHLGPHLISVSVTADE